MAAINTLPRCKTVIEYRELNAGDEALINSFFDEMGGESRAMFNRRDYNRRRALKYCRRSDNTRKYYAAFLGGELLGIVFLLDYNTGIPELGLALCDGFSGKGYGASVAQFAIDAARENGAGGVFLTTHVANVRAQALYEKLGFKLIGTCKDSTELAYLMKFEK